MSFYRLPQIVRYLAGRLGAAECKTWSLLLEPLRHIRRDGFRALIFRNTYKQIFMPGGMWDESVNIYRGIAGAKGVIGDGVWTFTDDRTQMLSVPKIEFSYLMHEDDKYVYDGAQIAYLGFDQLESFSESQFFYMFGRNRSTCGVKPYTRATCNPMPDIWLTRLLEWWIDQDTGYAIPERGGVIRWFIRAGDEIIWGDSRQELIDKYGANGIDVLPTSLTFVPATVYDNPILLEKDPLYLSKLQSLPTVDRERLLKGNWKIKEAAGLLFNRAWFEIVEAAPVGGKDIRFFDFAATAKAQAKGDPDFTADCKIRYVNGIWYVLDANMELLSPVQSEKRLQNIARQDKNMADEQHIQYMVGWEEEPGSASKRDSQHLATLIPGIAFVHPRSTHDKITNAKPFASQAEAGNVKLVRGAWNEMFLNHLHNQPAKHDDLMDAASNAFTHSTRGVWGFLA